MSIKSLYTEDSDELSETAIRYRCPFCEAVYTNELLTRVHITRSDDESHQNHDGLMPETKVEALDANGNVIDQIQRRPDDIDTRSLQPDNLPDEFDERKQRVLLIAAYHPHTETDTELHERATAVLEERDLDPVSYTTTRRWVHEFYMPQKNTAEETTTESTDTTAQTESKIDESLMDLTLKQQAVVIQHVADPEATDGEISDRVGCSRSYPYHVYDRASGLIERLTANREAGTSLEELLDTELEKETIKKLRDEGYLSGLEMEGESTADIEPVNEDTTNLNGEATDGSTTTPTAHVMSASPTDSLLPNYDIPREETNDTSVESHQAPPSEPEEQHAQTTPADLKESDNSDGKLADGSNETSPLQGPQTPDSSDVTTASPSDGATADHHASQDDVVPKADLEAVTERVQFLRRVFEREIETSEKPNARAQTQLAITQEVEAELEQLLAA